MRAPMVSALGALLSVFLGWAGQADATPFDSWAAVIVAGDYRAHSLQPSPVFDNARRDLAKALEKIGFVPSHILQFSVKPDEDKDTHPLPSDFETIQRDFTRLAQQTAGGCFVYITSHGAPQGVLVGDSIVSPRALAGMIDAACSDRLTVAVVSACYSGVFLPALRSDNRMILTAARPDRTSFGCGEANTYTFFDQCVLETLPNARDFPNLGIKVQECVAKREQEEHATPPSEPQIAIGANIASVLTGSYRFAGN
jgi:hypothetical protein